MKENVMGAGKRTIVLPMADTQLYYRFIFKLCQVLAFPNADAENLH